MTKRDYMLHAIELAKRGTGFVNPNPLVGAVIVKQGRIIGEGWHERYGELHAERNALKRCLESPEGAEMYVTLEPCCHWGKNPPCTDAIIEAKIKKVYVGSDDPNPLVAGKGIAILREHGIEVETQVCKAECDAINEIFFKYITTKQPYVILKTAMTCDGKTATYSGKSKWITNERSRRHTHFTRKRAAAIMVGIGTVLADDPELSCRIEDPSDPVRVVCDSGLRIPLDSRLVKTASRIPLIVATLSEDEEKIKKLEALGVIVYKAKEKAGRVDIRDVCTYLGSRGLDSLLVEGGSSLHGSFIDEGLVDMVQVYIGAKIFGGKMAAAAIGGRGAESPDTAMKLSAPEVTLLDGDVLLEYRVIK